ncbi:MAG: hypothetical protein ABI439_13050 [Rhodospirillales bacterium]
MAQGSRSMLQLDPPIPVDTPKGSAMAVILLDYGPDYDLMWVTFADATGECWTWKNSDIRGVKNSSLGRRSDESLNDNRPVPLRNAP